MAAAIFGLADAIIFSLQQKKPFTWSLLSKHITKKTNDEAGTAFYILFGLLTPTAFSSLLVTSFFKWHKLKSSSSFFFLHWRQSVAVCFYGENCKLSKLFRCFVVKFVSIFQSITFTLFLQSNPFLPFSYFVNHKHYRDFTRNSVSSKNFFRIISKTTMLGCYE